MCELFGFCADKAYDLNAWLKEFYSHSTQHPDGWGIATFRGDTVSVEKGSCCANDSSYLKELLSAPVVEPLLLAHIRKASVGSVQDVNSHPFTRCDEGGRCWTLIHNGTIFKSDVLEQYKAVQEGSTDSERILLYIVDAINALQALLGRKAAAKERFEVVDAVIAEISPGNKTNMILCDGEQCYIHVNKPESLHYLQMPDAVAVATQPLAGGDWQEVPLSTVIAFCEGKEVFRSVDHHHICLFTPEMPDLSA